MNPRPQPNRRRATVRLATVAVLAVLAAAGATALGGSQEPAPAPPPVGPPIAPPLGAGPSPAEQRLRELFVEVELALREIDDLLFDAAAGEAELDPRDAGIGRLLEQTEAKSREAVAGIDEILRVAREMEQQQQQQQSQQQQQGGQGQGSGQNSGGPSPLDGRSPGPRQQDLPGQGQQDPSTDQNQPQPRPDRSDGEPEDGPPTADEGQNEAGGDPRNPSGGSPSDPTGAGRWGDLPPRVQQVFNNQISDDIPVQYRDWIDRYHRRLSRSR
jgi:hypothetical protein